jgi:hypothetical protein
MATSGTQSRGTKGITDVCVARSDQQGGLQGKRQTLNQLPCPVLQLIAVFEIPVQIFDIAIKNPVITAGEQYFLQQTGQGLG